MKRYKSILCISDQHFPHNHGDIVSFLKEIKSAYSPERIVNIGDETDGHAMSFHEHDPDLLSPGKELETSIKRLQPIYKMFPEMDIMDSNHGSLVYRRGKAFGIPKHAFKSYQQMLEAPIGWKWHDHLVLQGTEGAPIYFCHGRSNDALKNSKNVSMNFVQGHHHSRFEIRYWANEVSLYWGMTIGCLIERRSLAFAYGKTLSEKPIIGCAIILDGWPRLLPMVLDKHGRWIGKLR